MLDDLINYLNGVEFRIKEGYEFTCLESKADINTI